MMVDVVVPGSVTDTWPWALTVSPEAFCGTVIAGCTRLPCALTMRPWLSIWKVPSRVYWKVPSGIWILKNPSPVMAISRSLPVCDSVPWVIERGVPTVLTPPPISMPIGRMLPWSEDCAPTRRTCS